MVGSLTLSRSSGLSNDFTSSSIAVLRKAVRPGSKGMTIRRSIERALFIFSIKFAFFSAVTPGIALIRLMTSSFVASISFWLSAVGEGLPLADDLSVEVVATCSEGVGLTFAEGVDFTSAEG